MSLQEKANPVAIIGALVTLGGLIGAIVLGQFVAHNDFLKIGAIGGLFAGIAIILIMGRSIWLLIPFCWPLTGKIQILPLPFTVQELAVIAAAGFYVLLLVFKKPLHHPKSGKLELFLGLNLLWLGIVFLRNPVGVRAFGTEMLGGRPYFEVILACFAFWVLTRTLIPLKLARTFPILMGAGSIIVSAVGTLTTIFPRLTPMVAPFYSGVDSTTYLQQEYQGGGGDAVGRLMPLRAAGTQIVGVLYALFPPLSLLNPTRFLRFVLFAGAMLAIFLSGFRSALIGAAVAFVITSYFWGGIRDAGRAIFLAFTALVVLVGAQSTGLSLPVSAQRALSFLPGDWDQAAVQDAQGTSKWRLEMWRTVLENPQKFLRSPILGTGFGFSQEDLNIQLSAAFGGQGYVGGTDFEAQLITGAFHNGPLSTVRFVGVIGLVLYYLLAIYMMIYSIKLVKMTKHSPYFYLAVFIATPTIYSLFSYTFIYGAFDTALQGALFNCAMLRCTSESHRIWLKSQISNQPAKADLIKSISLPTGKSNDSTQNS